MPMKTQDSFLYKKLQDQPAAPSQGFEKFVVGELQIQRTEVIALLDKMLNNQEPSRIQAIIGPNGNGKTLLNNALKYHATETNLQKTEEGITATFDVLFSHIMLNMDNPNSFGVELAKNLQRTIYEPPQVTYAVIAARIAQDFADNYVPPFYLRLPGWLPKFLVKKTLERYQSLLSGLITDNDYKAFSTALDSVFAELAKRLTSSAMKRTFQEYIEKKEISSFMKGYFKSDSFRITIKELNTSLYDDFRVNQGTVQPLDTIRAMATIAKDVGCKVLIIMVDDCNLNNSPRMFLPIVEYLSDFEGPKLLFVINAVTAKWEKMTSDTEDLSFKQKLGSFGNPIKVKSPSKSDLVALLYKLLGLMNDELTNQGFFVRLSDVAQKEILSKCPTTSYREATKFIIDNLERYKIPT